jgi:hypothetical protein
MAEGRDGIFHMHCTLNFAVALSVLAAWSANVNAGTSAQVENQARPSSPQPDFIPPAPPNALPPAPSAQAVVPHAAPNLDAALVVPMPSGQWVFTQEYGWMWLPHDQMYAQVVENSHSRFGYSSVAYEYAYYPAFGWRWVVAPWILRFGAVPYWGALGPAHFAWYAHPWFRIASLEGSQHDEPISRPQVQKP